MKESFVFFSRILKSSSNEPDETIYQKARRIVIAEWQHIIFNEWLPLAIGRKAMRARDLYPKTRGYTNDYDRSLDPRIHNEFAAAAFR